MTDDEANIIFARWQQYTEIIDKFRALMLTPPPSFLPYPPDVLEDAINIVAKSYFDSGDSKTAITLQRHMTLSLGRYFRPEKNRTVTDEEALAEMAERLSLILSNPPLKAELLGNLRNLQRGWMETRQGPASAVGVGHKLATEGKTLRPGRWVLLSACCASAATILVAVAMLRVNVSEGAQMLEVFGVAAASLMTAPLISLLSVAWQLVLPGWPIYGLTSVLPIMRRNWRWIVGVALWVACACDATLVVVGAPAT
jgi:hypothetical protein